MSTFSHPRIFDRLAEPKLEFLFHLQCDMEGVLDVGGPHGDRKTVFFTGGLFEGPRLKGKVLPGGADWLITKDDGTAYLDTRYNLQTHDGANIYIQTRGVRKGPPEVLRSLYTDTEVPADRYSFRLTLTLETGDERYSWLNKAVVLASAARSGKQVIYDAYEVL